jgi:hypothetical protein
MSSGFLKALGVLAKSPSLNRYLNVLKPAEEGVSRGMDYFNNAIKKVVDEGNEIEKTLDTRKFVHPDRPDIFVEIDVNTGNVNVGLLDEEAGAFAYSDLELDPRSADIKEKAKLMKEMGKSKGRGKRKRMIEAANKILRDKKADGGRSGYFLGGLLRLASKTSPLQAYKKYLQSVKTRAQKGDMKSLVPELGAVSGAGIFVNRRMQDVLENMKEKDMENNLENFKNELDNDPFYLEYPELKDKILENYMQQMFGENKADGGRVGMFMGGSLPKGAGLLRQMIRMAAKDKGLEKPSEMLSKFNPKRADKFLDDPNLLFMKANVKEGIMATDAAKQLKETGQSIRIDVVEYLLKMAKDLRSMNLTTKEQTAAMIEAAVKMGMDRKQAEFLSKGLAKAAEGAAGGPIRNAPEPTEQGILELETILKNLKTGGKPSRSLNADGGYIGLKDGGEVSLTVIEIPDISGSGVETLFKKR